MKVISFMQAQLQGLARYFTGKSCIYGHVAERFVCNCQCIECHRIKNRKDWLRRGPVVNARRRKQPQQQAQST